MSLSPRKTGPVVLMLFLAHLFAPAVQALPLSGKEGGFRHGDVFTAAREWLGSILLPAHEKLGSPEVWRKAGSQMDPNGVLQSSDFAPATGKAGSQMDPDGYK